MKRLIAIGLSVLMLVGFSAHAAYEMSDSAKEGYLKWIKKGGGSWTYALAVSSNGGYASGWGTGIYTAKSKALKKCKKITKSTSCKIMDVDGKSAFIKKRDSSSYSSSSSSSYSSTASSTSYGGRAYCHDSKYNLFYRSGSSRCAGSDSKISKREFTNKRLGSSSTTTTASSSSNIWCATKYSVSKTSRYSCTQNKGKAFWTYSSALAEKNRLNKSSSSSSSTASSSGKVWCGTKKEVTRVSRYSCEFYKGGKAFDTQSEATAFHKRLKANSSSTTTTASSSSNIWCATKYSVSKTSRYSCTQNKGKAFHSYSSALAEKNRLNKSSSGSGTLVWCGKSFKLSCSSSSSSSTASSSSKIWCATKYSVSKTSRYSCTQNKGKAFWTYSSALAEKNRLKSSSSSYSSTASSSNSNLVWCATNKWWRYTLETSCRSAGGKIYPSKYQAVAANKRLKAASTPLVKTASLTIRSNVNGDRVYIDGNFKGTTRLDLKLSKGRHTIRIEKNGYEPYEETIYLTDNLIIRGHLEKVVKQQVQTAAVDSSLELEFWKTIKDSDNPDMFRAYIDQFPDGVYGVLAKIKLKALGGDVSTVAQSSIPNLDYGRYHALVIGNDRYQHLKNLSTAVNDANAVASLLRSRYQFNVDVLTNATRDETVSALSRLRRTISSKDNLLIYYAGHGWLDKDMDEGFWLPVDAVDDDQVHWIANDTIMRSVRAMKAKHVMVVADSCFSGTLIRGIKIRERSPDYIKQIVQKKARTALTSGGLEPVTDVGGGNHSIFAATFMRILNENTGVLDGHQLFTTLRKRVMMNADQTPEYGDIRKAGHDGGDFLFVRQ